MTVFGKVLRPSRKSMADLRGTTSSFRSSAKQEVVLLKVSRSLWSPWRCRWCCCPPGFRPLFTLAPAWAISLPERSLTRSIWRLSTPARQTTPWWRHHQTCSPSAWPTFSITSARFNSACTSSPLTSFASFVFLCHYYEHDVVLGTIVTVIYLLFYTFFLNLKENIVNPQSKIRKHLLPSVWFLHNNINDNYKWIFSF